MKKIFVLAYSKMNIGDDLFVDTLVKRYPYVKFFSRAIDKESMVFKDNNNLNFLDWNLDDLIQKDISSFDGMIYIGGSIFMEHAGGIERIQKLKQIATKCKSKNIPFYFVSSNFGPFETKEYRKEVEALLALSTDVCFRDINSYNEFSHLKSVRYAPDAILGVDFIKYDIEPNTIGISILDFKAREKLKAYKDSYKKELVRFINESVSAGYKIKLFSFCEYEGDYEAALETKSLVNDSDAVEIINYQGDLKNFITKYSQVEYMVCSRFHSMILSMIFEQKIYLLSYSDKIKNVIEDIDMTEEYYTIDNISEEQIELSKFEQVSRSLELKMFAKSQFSTIDNLLKEYDNDEEKVTVIVPAYNEEKRVAKVIKLIKKNLIVSQIIVVDNNSSDLTAVVAKKAGADVVSCKIQGKGNAMEEGLKHAVNDIIVYLDADICDYSNSLIFNLTKPLIDNDADFVKSTFDRVGGRVTELVAKPLLKILFPDMYQFSQPLSGMIACKKDFLEKIEFEKDYGVDIAILLDMIFLGARVQEVYIGKITNASQTWKSLEKMSENVMNTIIKKAKKYDKLNNIDL